MKILFVHLGREHLGIEYLSSVLRNAGHETELAMDVGLFGQNDNIFYIPRLERRFDLSASILKKFKEYDPGLVCFSAYSTTLQWCFNIAAMIKKGKAVPTVIGGSHITLVPQSAMLSPDMDYGVWGEAEKMIVSFVSRIEGEGSLEDVPGLIFRRGEEIRVNPVAPLEDDLDSLPFPDKRLFEHALNISDDYMTLTSRGCIFNCSYCCEHYMKEMYRGQVFRRVRSVESLMGELRTMYRRYHFSEVYFACPMFPPKKEWVSDFAEKYRKEIGKPFWCFGHINFFDREYAELLRDAGCRNVEFGIQTLNEDVRRNVLAREETNERLAEALDICDRVGLHYDVDAIFHLPGEKEEDYERAVRFYARFKNIHRIKVFNLTLFPGTRIVDYAVRHGYIDEETHRAMSEGRLGDFFHLPMLRSPLEKWKLKAYENLLRLLPILPEGLILRLLRPRALRGVSYFPGFFVRSLEMLNLVKRKDLRLVLYLKIYARHFFLHLTGRRRA